MDINAIRAGLQTVLSGVPRLRAYDKIPEKPEPSCVVVAPDEPFISYLDAMAGGLCTLHFDLVLFVQRGDDRAAQKNLDDLLSTGNERSVFDCLRADRTLGGLVSDVVPRGVTDYGAQVTIGDSTFGQAVIKTDVYTPRLS